MKERITTRQPAREINDSTVPEYFSLLGGKQASRKQIQTEHPFLTVTIDSMVKYGSVIGQRTFIEPSGEIGEDVIYIMPMRGGSFNGKRES